MKQNLVGKNKNIIKKIISLCLIVTILGTQLSVNAFAEDNNHNNDIEDIEDSVLSVAEDEVGFDVNTDIYSDDENVLVADGYELMISVPSDAEEDIELDDGYDNSIGFSLPEEAKDMTPKLGDEQTVVYADEDSDVLFDVSALQLDGDNENTMEGVRTSIMIQDENASHDYSFEFDLPEGTSIITSKEYLGDEFDTGELYLIDANNEIQMIIDNPWAKDAEGNSVETYYSVDGNTITQHISFDQNTKFPVVADPSVWSVAKCAASILWVIGSTVLAAAKIVKIKKYVKALGGAREAAVLMIGATTGAEKWTTFAKTLLNLSATLLGVDSLVKNCPVKTVYNKCKKYLKK